MVKASSIRRIVRTKNLETISRFDMNRFWIQIQIRDEQILEHSRDAYRNIHINYVTRN